MTIYKNFLYGIECKNIIAQVKGYDNEDNHKYLKWLISRIHLSEPVFGIV